MARFQALVGPNASGKTTFLDVLALMSDLMRNRGEVLPTIQARSTDFSKLLWMEEGQDFQLAVEAPIPEAVQQQIASNKRSFSHVRYEIVLGLDPQTNEIGLDHETLWLGREVREEPEQITMFPSGSRTQHNLLLSNGKGRRVAIRKKSGGNDNYYPEGKKSYQPSFRLGRHRAALANIPADEESFPVSTWFRNLLEQGIQKLVLNSTSIRSPSPPGQGPGFRADGSNLPWVIAELRKNDDRFKSWLEHVQTALEDIRDIDTVERPEDKHRYLVVEYANGARVPSWLVSDGTLRLLALTITAYLEDLEGIFLIEEPENGIHPRAIEVVLQSLYSIYGGQVLIATHSPVAVNMLKPRDVLCFAKDTSGATDIVSGDRHPALKEWKRGGLDLGMLFASGILS